MTNVKESWSYLLASQYPPRAQRATATGDEPSISMCPSNYTHSLTPQRASRVPMPEQRRMKQEDLFPDLATQGKLKIGTAALWVVTRVPERSSTSPAYLINCHVLQLERLRELAERASQAAESALSEKEASSADCERLRTSLSRSTSACVCLWSDGLRGQIPTTAASAFKCVPRQRI